MKNTVVLILAFFIASCSSHGPIFKEKINKIEVDLPLESFSISISDLRSNVDDVDSFLKPVLFGTPDTIAPAAPVNLKRELVSIINESKVEGNTSIRFQVEIQEAFMTFRNSAFGTSDYARVILNIKAFNSKTDQLIDQTVSMSWGEKDVFSSVYMKGNRMYLKTFKHAFKLGIKKLNI